MHDQQNTARVARVAVTANFLLKIMKNGLAAARVVENRLPDDAIYLSSFANDGLIWLVISSESFDLVEPGEVMPILPTPTFKKLAPMFH